MLKYKNIVIKAASINSECFILGKGKYRTKINTEAKVARSNFPIWIKSEYLKIGKRITKKAGIKTTDYFEFALRGNWYSKISRVNVTGSQIFIKLSWETNKITSKLNRKH